MTVDDVRAHCQRVIDAAAVTTSGYGAARGRCSSTAPDVRAGFLCGALAARRPVKLTRRLVEIPRDVIRARLRKLRAKET